jgi:hypothetical protein
MVVREHHLPMSTPEAQGVPSAAIVAFIDAAEARGLELHSLMLLRHGHVLAEGWWAPYRAEEPHMLFSLSKSFTSTAIGLAIAEGHLTVDDPVLSFFPDEAPAAPGEGLTAMRVRHLLSMSTGHDVDTTGALRDAADGDWARAFLAQPVTHTPGTYFVYNSGATYMLSAILQRLTGTTMLDYLRPRPRSAGYRGGDLGDLPARDQHRRLGPQHHDCRYRPLRPALLAGRRLGRAATPAARLGRGGERGAHRQQQSPERQPRLDAGLRLPVLALPPRRLSR